MEEELGNTKSYSNRVAQLMQVVQRDPGNKEALLELGESFLAAKQWQPAGEWFAKLAAVDPSNVRAWTRIGTASFNLGLMDPARAA